MLLQMTVWPVECQHGLPIFGAEKHSVPSVFPEKRGKLTEMACDLPVVGFGQPCV